jgi:hypothetical protein
LVFKITREDSPIDLILNLKAIRPRIVRISPVQPHGHIAHIITILQGPRDLVFPPLKSAVVEV